MWIWPGLAQDLRYGFRQIRRGGGFSAVVIATLALGIGGTTAVFTVLQGVLLAPLPSEQPGRLVRFYQQEPDKPATRHYLTATHFTALRDQAASFDYLAALANYSETGLDLVRDGQAQRLRVLQVTSDYFRPLRSLPLRGRGFDREDDAGTSRVVLNDRIWRTRFGSDPSVIGATIQLSAEPYEDSIEREAGKRWPGEVGTHHGTARDPGIVSTVEGAASQQRDPQSG